MKLSILIVNYNGMAFLPDCLASIRQQVTLDHEVIVVDNASSDGSCDYVRAAHPRVKLVVSARNLGFAGGNNLGARQACGEYLLLLNNDTVLTCDVRPAIELLDNNPDIGIAGARMLDGKSQYSRSAGHFPTPLRLISISNVFKKDGYFERGDFPAQGPRRGYQVDWVAGSFLLTRRFLWHELRGLDDGYFMYCEDADYCRRARDVGQSTSYCPQVSYIHYGGFELSRFPLIIKGYRRYHVNNSGVLVSLLASGILYGCVALRILIFGLRYLVSRNTETRNKIIVCLQVFKTDHAGDAVKITTTSS
jgi:GT2 family glycosyltransferase